MTNKWEYFGRRNGRNEVIEIYRMPTDVDDPMDRFAAKQRLRKGLFWLEDPEDTALSNEWATGWFDFDEDRLTEDQVASFIAEWVDRPVWPGRP
jgi:hypothetical protein